MQSSFCGCLLVQDGSTAPELKQTEVNLHPGQQPLFSPKGTVCLAGGFTSVSPGSTVPLSPTLQLNQDLAKHSHEVLEKIALAEYQRQQLVALVSRTVEPDRELCVIAQRPESLAAFLDIYGGLLAITPLLAGGSHPDYRSTRTIELSERQGHCVVTCQLPSPIELEKCTYCGRCAACCPENCISENLYVDFTACSRCKLCEQECPTGAIAIDGINELTLRTPAVLLMDGLEKQLPRLQSVYPLSRLTDYLSSLCPVVIEETVLHNPSLCQYSTRLGGGCDLCVSACRHGAVSQTSTGVEVDQLSCQDCGACVGDCPTGALEDARLQDSSWQQYLQLLPSLQGMTVVLGEEATLHRLWWQNLSRDYPDTFFLEVPKLAGVSTMHLFSLLARGAAQIMLVADDEKAAESRQVAQGKLLAAEIFEKDTVITWLQLKDFAKAFDNSGKISIAPLRQQAPAGDRRRSLAAVLEYLVNLGKKVPAFSPTGYLPFASLQCDAPGCTQCMACLNECRIGALSAGENGYVLNHRQVLCVGCGLCVQVCPEEVMSLASGFTMDRSFFHTQVLADGDPILCKTCGKAFGTRKSFEKVMSILQAKETVDVSHFEHCETCRVVKIFS